MGVVKTLMAMAGAAGGAVAWSFSANRRKIEVLQHSVDDLGSRLAEQHQQSEARYQSLESRLNDHESRLNEMPSTEKIVGAVQEMLANTMGCLDERLSQQAEAIAVLKTTVSQTDQLLERVVNSLEALKQNSGSPNADSV